MAFTAKENAELLKLIERIAVAAEVISDAVETELRGVQDEDEEEPAPSSHFGGGTI
jgi:hypothetical protein